MKTVRLIILFRSKFFISFKYAYFKNLIVEKGFAVKLKSRAAKKVGFLYTC